MTAGRLTALVAAGMLCLALAVGAVPLVLDLTACGGAEKRALAEFSHYGGVRPPPSGNADAGSCMVTYRAAAPEERVLAYYQQALRIHGWTVQPLQATADGAEFRSGELTARRGTDTYTVLNEAGPALKGGGTHLAVHVAGD